LSILFRVNALLLHKPDSSFSCSLLDVLSGLREEVAKLLDLLLFNAHEEDVWKLLLVLVIVQRLLMSLVNQIRLQVKENLEISEVRVFGEVEDWLLLVNSALLVVADLIVISLIVVNIDKPLSDKEHFLNISFIADDNLAWNVDSAEHVDDQVVGEASLAFFKEVVKRLLKISKGPSTLDQFSLHLWSDLLIELEFFDD